MALCLRIDEEAIRDHLSALERLRLATRGSGS